MAITFRDFFIGLSEQAPVVAQLVHDYTIWNYQKGMAERKMALEERMGEAEIAKSKSISQYYEKGAELDEARFNLTKEEYDATIDLKIRRAEAEADTAEHARELQKFETNIAMKPMESLTPEEKTRKLEIMNDRNLKNEETRARIQQLIASASSEKAREIFYTEEAGMKRVQSLNDYMDTFEGWMTNPEQIPTFEKAISESVDKNGKIDWQKIYENRKAFDTVPVFMRNPFMRIAEDRIKFASEIRNQHQRDAITVRDLAMSKDPKEREIGNGFLGRKGSTAIPYIELEPLIQGYIAYQDSVSEGQQLTKLQDTFDKFFERFAPTTIPDYSDAGGAREGTAAVGPPVPEVEVLGKSLNPYMSDEAYAKAQKEREEKRKRIREKERTPISLYGER